MKALIPDDNLVISAGWKKLFQIKPQQPMSGASASPIEDGFILVTWVRTLDALERLFNSSEPSLTS